MKTGLDKKWSGRSPLKWPIMVLASWYSPPVDCGLDLLTHLEYVELNRSDGLSYQRLGCKKTVLLSWLFSLTSSSIFPPSPLWKLIVMSSEGSVGKPVLQALKQMLRPANSHVNELGITFTCSCWTWWWPSSHQQHDFQKPWAAGDQLSHSQILEPQTLKKTTNIYLFKLLHFVMACSIATNN